MGRPNYQDLTYPEEVSMKPFPSDPLMSGQSKYIGPGSSDKAGAGRGRQGGPTAKELRDYERAQKPESKKSGGKVGSASKRADGIAERGKTRGTMVMCSGGYTKGKK